MGPVTALAPLCGMLTIGPVERFRTSKQVVSYLGLNPRERRSGGQQRLGSISKQGNSMLRWLLNEAAQTAAQFDPELRRDYLRLQFRRGKAVPAGRDRIDGWWQQVHRTIPETEPWSQAARKELG